MKIYVWEYFYLVFLKFGLEKGKLVLLRVFVDWGEILFFLVSNVEEFTGR